MVPLPLAGGLFKTTEGSTMPAIFDFLYREYCRARLAEMRKQLSLVQTNGPEIQETVGNVSGSDGATLLATPASEARVLS